MQKSSTATTSYDIVNIPIKNNIDGTYEGYLPTVKDKWEIIELQGSLSTRPDKAKPLDNVILGQLTNTTAGPNQPLRCDMLIGRQKCEGKAVSVKKPLVILQKVKSESDGSIHYRVVGVIRDKLHFASRPVPLSPSKENGLPATTTTASTTTNNSNSTQQSKVQKATKNLSTIHPMFLPKKKNL
jgi:hypothetical protein